MAEPPSPWFESSTTLSFNAHVRENDVRTAGPRERHIVCKRVRSESIVRADDHVQRCLYAPQTLVKCIIQSEVPLRGPLHPVKLSRKSIEKRDRAIRRCAVHHDPFKVSQRLRFESLKQGGQCGCRIPTRRQDGNARHVVTLPRHHLAQKYGARE